MIQFFNILSQVIIFASWHGALCSIWFWKKKVFITKLLLIWWLKSLWWFDAGCFGEAALQMDGLRMLLLLAPNKIQLFLSVLQFSHSKGASVKNTFLSVPQSNPGTSWRMSVCPDVLLGQKWIFSGFLNLCRKKHNWPKMNLCSQLLVETF